VVFHGRLAEGLAANITMAFGFNSWHKASSAVSFWLPGGRRPRAFNFRSFWGFYRKEAELANRSKNSGEVDRGQYGIRITKKGMFKKEIEKPHIAICPKCGEISMYISTPEIISK
jgi:hypothetical protein